MAHVYCDVQMLRNAEGQFIVKEFTCLLGAHGNAVKYQERDSNPRFTELKSVALDHSAILTYPLEKRMWLSYSERDKQLFCWICVAFCSQRKSNFITGWGGNDHWESGHCYSSISRHEISLEHQHAVESFHLFSLQSSINHCLDLSSLSLRKKQVAQRRDVVLKIIEIVLFLAKQSLPFRAKNNEAAYALSTPCNHGNFLEEVKSRATFDPILKAHLDSVIKQSQKRHNDHSDSRGRGSLVTFLSKTTFQKILYITKNLIVKYIRDQIIENGGTYSITMDGSQDVSVQEVMAFVIRYVDEFGPVECLVDVSVMKSTSSKALLEHTVDILENKLSLKLEDLAGYSFDGAGNMAGANAGLEALLKERVPLSVFQHCYAHILSLCLEKTCTAVLLGSATFDLLRDSCTIISESYKRSLLWKSVSSFLCNKTRMLVKLGKTRWWARARACSRIFTDSEDSLLPVVIVALEIISRDKDLPAKSRAKALGDLSKWCTFETIAVGMLFNKIFQMTGPVSDYLQTPQLDHIQAARLTSQLIPDVSGICIDQVLNSAKELADHSNAKLDELNLTKDFTDEFGEIESRVASEATRRRISTVPRRLGERSEDEIRRLAEANSPNWHVNVNTLIPIKDNCITNLQNRFGDDKLTIFKSCAFLSLERFAEVVKDGIPSDALETLCKLAGTDKAVVSSELSGDSDSDEERNETTEKRKTDGSPSAVGCKGCLRCPYRILRKHRLYTAAFGQLYRTYKFALTLPCTQVTCERCFSKLKITCCYSDPNVDQKYGLFGYVL
ncbi:Zinc finger MYM-type protein 1 [Frankliniella fusca]|uniref:Zinc finger MYM-type protein 1 n=1 Tax=Frankliniella fusca TaxID=407009 RepID=A0AAE1LFB1_9NEOP|nr:Zinc finger MYM-type protein 1 [Frankliniella fusca]